MARVVLENISKTSTGPKRERIEAVRGVSLDVAEGECIVILGPSGCGKTTALRLIAGLEELTSGTIMIGGKAMQGVEPQDRDVAMVFQQPALYPHMTAFGNMAFGLKLRKLPAAQKCLLCWKRRPNCRWNRHRMRTLPVTKTRGPGLPG